MGKVQKGVKIVDKPENKLKVKKLLNNPGVTKASVKLNLKETRAAPLTKIVLKNKSNIVNNKNVNLIEDPKSIKIKKNKFSKNTENNSADNIKVDKKILQDIKTPIMKTLKRKSNTENNVKLPIPKKKVNSPVVVQVQKQAKKKPVKEEIDAIEIEKNTPVIQEIQQPKLVKENVKKILKVKSEITDGIITIDKPQIVKGVSAVLKLAKIQSESKKNLFDGEHQPIFLQVSCIKVPKVPKRRLRMMLPHTLVTATDDVALFVGDLKKGRAQDFEPTINHYEDLLRENDCKQIKDVIPLTQVKTEYDQYELKRKLLSSYDYFLTDGKIAGHLSHLLGKIFINKRKLPTSIKMDSKNLKNEIDNALKKTSLQLHSQGNSHTVQIAHTNMKKQDILENVIYVCKNLAQNYPGGWTNIRSLILKTATSLSVPIYITLKSKNKVKVPVVIPTRPKAHRTVSGELSTAPGHTKVIVRPDGTVETKRIRKYNKFGNKEDDESSTIEKSELTTTDESTTKKSKRNKKRTTETEVTKTKDNIPKTETNDSEDEIEEAEQAYLNQWQEESTVAVNQENKEKKKETKEKKKKSKIVKKKKTKVTTSN